MKIYLASRYSRNPEMRTVRDVMAEFGHSVTSRWIDQHGGELEESFTPERLSAEPSFCGRFAEIDVDDVMAADCVVSYTGAGGKGGRHVEFGIGYAAGKRTIVVGEREHVFHCLPRVEIARNTVELVELLREGAPGAVTSRILAIMTRTD